MDKMKMHTVDFTESNIEKIGQLFPGCVTERISDNGHLEKAIDFDMLRQELSKEIVEGPQERYQFTWPDKRKSIRLANAPTTMALRPCREDSVDFDKTENLYLEGDNLEVLKVIRETYLGKVKMIYIDPPYNTGRDFVYKDTFNQHSLEYLQNSGQFDDQGQQLVQNTENNGRFHTDWLNMMYVRIKTARDILADDGVIFISIDDNEVDELKKICTEIFGENNFVGCAGRITKKSNNKGDFWAPNFDYILTFTKNRDLATEFTGGANYDSYNLIEEDGPRKGERYQLVRLYMSSLQNRNPEQRFWIDCPDGSKIIPPGSTFPPERPNLGDGIWRWSRSTFEANKDKIVVKRVNSSNLLDENHNPAKWNVFTKTYLNDVLEKSSAKPNSFIEDYINQLASHELNELGIPFDYAKPTALIKYLLEVAQIGDGDIVLDFFSGSASTADAVMQYNSEKGKRVQFIMVQLDEKCEENSKALKEGYKTICEIGKERIRRAGKKIAGSHKNNEDSLFSPSLSTVDTGFRVLKLDTSNMEDVYYRPEESSDTSLFEDNIKSDRTSEDLLFQVMLQCNLPLSAKIEFQKIAGKDVYSVNNGYLIACFDTEVNEDVIKAIAKRKPYYFVMRDSSLSSDNVADNFEQIFQAYSKETIRRIL